MKLDYINLAYKPSIDDTKFVITFSINDKKIDLVVPHGTSHKELAKLVKTTAKEIKHLY